MQSLVNIYIDDDKLLTDIKSLKEVFTRADNIVEYYWIFSGLFPTETIDYCYFTLSSYEGQINNSSAYSNALSKMIVLLAARYEYDEKAMDYLFELFKTKSNLREAILSSFSSNLGISLQSYRSNFKPQILLLTKCLKLLETDIEFLDVLDVLVKLYLPFEHECSEMQHDKDTQKDVIKIHRFQLPVSNETEKFRELVWSSVKVLYDNGRIGKLLELPYSNVYGANNIDSEFGIAPGLFFYSYYIFNT